MPELDDRVEQADALLRETLPLLQQTVTSTGVEKDVGDEENEMSAATEDQVVIFDALPTSEAKVLFTVCEGIKTSLALRDFSNAYQLLSLLVPCFKVKEIMEQTSCTENAVKIAKTIAKSADSYPGASSAAKPKCTRMRVHPDALSHFINWFSDFLKTAEDNRKNNKRGTEFVMQSDAEGIWKEYNKITLNHDGKKLSRSVVLSLVNSNIIAAICAEEASCATCYLGHLAVVDAERISAELQVIYDRLIRIHKLHRGSIDNIFEHLKPKIDQVKDFMQRGYATECLRSPNSLCTSHCKSFGLGHPFNDHYSYQCNHDVTEPALPAPPGMSNFHFF